MEYVLLDLERSVSSGMTTYWKENSRGYTVNVEHAGQYSEKDAIKLANDDVEHRTVAIPKSVISNIVRP